MADIGNWIEGLLVGAFGFGAGWALGREDALNDVERPEAGPGPDLPNSEEGFHRFEDLSGDGLLAHTFIAHFPAWNEHAQSNEKLRKAHRKAHDQG